jgi:hypothetical protein
MPELTFSDKEDLIASVGEEVCVAVCVNGIQRNGHWTQMSIQGILEVHPEDDDSYRVVNAQRTYTYFRTEDVILVNPLTLDLTTINVRIDLKKEYEDETDE